MRAFACSLAFTLAGCSAVLHFHECNQSSDCAPKNGVQLYCNVEHECVDTSPCYVSTEATAPGTPLVIVGMYLLSHNFDPSQPNDHAIRQAVDLAARELNAQSVPVRHVACDTGGDKSVALSTFDLAIKQFKPVAVVGPNTSDEMLALKDVIPQRGVVVVSPAATAAAIAGEHMPDANLTWRTCASDNLQASVLATLVPATAKPLDVVWTPADPYADGLAQQFISISGRTDETPVQFGTGMVADAVAQMKSPAYAVLVVDVDAPALVAALHGASGQSTTQYLMTDAALTTTLWGTGPYDFSFLTRIRGTAPGLPPMSDPSSSVYAEFDLSYRGAFNQEDPANTAFVPNAYDAAYAIAIGAAAAGPSPTGAKIAANLARMSDHAGTSIDVDGSHYQAAVNALVGGGTIDLVGASGPIDWDGNGDVLTAPVEVWQIANDGSGNPTFATIKTVTP